MLRCKRIPRAYSGLARRMTYAGEGPFDYRSGLVRATPSLELQHFLFLGLAHLFHLLDFVVGELLNLVERALLVVFGDLLVLHRLLDRIVAVAAYVADGSAVLFQNPVQMLDHFLAALFGKRGYGHADQFAVVHRIEAQIAAPDGLFDRA